MKTKVLIALIAMVVAVACESPNDGQQKSKHEQAVENIVAQCQNFDHTTFAQELPGVWRLDTDVSYDDNWEKITDWCLVVGEYNNECNGWRGTTYTFTADGKGSRAPWYYFPDEDETPLVFDWHYDVESNQLVFSGDWNSRMTVSGFNGEYLVFDYYDTSNERNVRNIYKRQAE